MVTREITFAQAIREAMAEEMRGDDNIVFMGEDIAVYRGAFGVSAGMLEEFGDARVIDTPTSETAFMGCAIGAAVTGMRPIVELMYSDFSAVCFDQIINQAAKFRYMYGGKVKVPMVIRTPTGAGTGAAAQHSQSLENLFCGIAGLKVIVPSTPHDAKGLLKTAIRDDNCCVFLEPKLLYKTTGAVSADDYAIPLGVADIKRAGDDTTIITYGRCVQMALEAAQKLEADGISAEVLDLRTLSPLDTDAIIASVSKTGRAVVVHEAAEFGGFGGEIVATIMESAAFKSLKSPVVRICGLNSPVPFNPVLEKAVLPSAERIEQAIRKIV